MSYRSLAPCLLPAAAAALSLALAGCGASPKTPELTPTLTQASLSRPIPSKIDANPRIADRILVKKGERRLYLMKGDQPFRSYRIALGYQPVGHKRRQGDGRTPEGRYFLDWRSERSNFRKALHISYPNSQDRLRAQRDGVDPGGAIMIHGQPNRRRAEKTGDWTFGCIAVSDMAIDEIWGYTAVGIPIEILP